MKKQFFSPATMTLICMFVSLFWAHNAQAKPPKPKSLTISACDSYLWTTSSGGSGLTYTNSGTYTYTNTGTNTAWTLHLTINHSTSTILAVNQCGGSYTWPANGQTYTASGTYTKTSLNTSGCTYTQTLNLVISYPVNTNTYITACDSYTWPANGQMYITSGTYTNIVGNPGGCVNTDTLHLTINQSTPTTTLAVAQCEGSFTWPTNGQTYTTSGLYTYSSLNSVGCPYVQQLDLVISKQNQTLGTNLTLTKCNDYSWNGQTYSASGVYTYTTSNPGGCPSVDTLTLTIVSCKIADNSVSIEGENIPKNIQVWVYDLEGRCVYKTQQISDQKIPIQKNGEYPSLLILSANGKTLWQTKYMKE